MQRRRLPDCDGRERDRSGRRRAATGPPRLAGLLDERHAARLSSSRRFRCAPWPTQPQRLRDDDGAQRRRADHPARHGLASRGLTCCDGISARHLRLQAARNVVHFGSQICWTIAITVLAVRDRVRARIHDIPAWVTLLAVLFLGERMTATRAGALAICFVGVLVILRPGHRGVSAGRAAPGLRRAAVRDRGDRSPRS